MTKPSNRKLSHKDLLRDKGDGLAGPSGTRRPSHTVDVVLGMGGDVKIDDHVHMRDVQTSVENTTSFTSACSSVQQYTTS